MRLTDRAAGRLAWVVFGASVAFFVFSVVLKILNAGSKYVSHDAGDLAVEASFVLAIGSFAVAGLLITRQQPRHTIGWLMLAIGLTLAWGDLSEGYIRYALATNPGSLPGPGIVVGLSSWLWVPAIGLVGTFLILLFPDGHLPSRRWRVISWLSGLTLLGLSLAMMVAPSSYEDAGIPSVSNPFEIEALAPVLQRLGPLLALFPLCILACAASLVVRFRRSSGVKRLQLKWLATAGALAAALYLLAMLASSVGPGARDPEPGWVTTLTDVALVCFTVIPVAIGVAVLKHRLYDIDVVINKALVLGVLAAFITAVYVAIVVGVGSLVGRGDEPNLALSIAATAVVAVAFQPVRDRVQRFANRLVYGSRATPYEVLSNFADRVGGSYDAAELLPMMARTVAQGVGAARVDVWLSIGSGLVREATWPQTPPEHGQSVTTAVDDMTDLTADRVVPVRHHGDLLGAITVTKAPGEPVIPAEDKLLDDVAAQAGLVLRNVQLIEELRSSRQRLVTTQDHERRRLERNLHDGAQQSLVSVALMIRTIRARLSPDDPACAGLDAASEQLRLAIEELRELARGIHPAILTDRGLGPAIESLAERCPVPVFVDYQLTQRPDPIIEATLYFVVAEALTNIAKYAHATEATITATTTDTDSALTLDVTDNGIGGADTTKGSGLRGLTDRIAVIDGTLTITSPPGQGTQLTCTIPLTPQPTNAVPHQDSIPMPVGASQ